MEKSISINYKRIYSDILKEKFPEKELLCHHILIKEKLSALDIVELNQKIFGTLNEQTEHLNQKLRSYSKSDILEILSYQKKYNLNNTQLSIHFKMSRNTISKWRKMFLV